jgi:hypothetical protein
VTDPKLASPSDPGRDASKPKPMPKPGLLSPSKTTPNPDEDPKKPQQKPVEGGSKAPSGSLKIKPPNKK